MVASRASSPRRGSALRPRARGRRRRRRHRGVRAPHGALRSQRTPRGRTFLVRVGGRGALARAERPTHVYGGQPDDDTLGLRAHLHALPPSRRMARRRRAYPRRPASRRHPRRAHPWATRHELSDRHGMGVVARVAGRRARSRWRMPGTCAATRSAERCSGRSTGSRWDARGKPSNPAIKRKGFARRLSPDTLEGSHVEVDRGNREGAAPGGMVPGTVSDEIVEKCRRELDSPGAFAVHPAAAQAIRQFGGLRIRVEGPGRDSSKSSVDLEPTLAVGEADRMQTYFPCLRNRDVYPSERPRAATCF